MKTVCKNLPNEWNWAKFEDLLIEKPCNGLYKSGDFIGQGILFLDINGLYSGLTADFSRARRVKVTESEYQQYALTEGDILFNRVSKMPEGVGKAVVVDELEEPAVYESNMIRVRLKGHQVDSRFIAYYLSSNQSRQELLSKANISNQASINQQAIKSLSVPLPPIAEQRRIAAILDRADAVRRKRQAAIGLTEELLRSAFLEMFGDPVTNLKGWETQHFGNIGTLDRGKSKHRPRNDPSLLGGSYPLIQTGDVANCNGLIAKYSQTYSEKGLAQSKLWKAGTLCITIAANIAQTGILTFDACFPDSVVGFHPGEKVTVEYVQGWLGFLQPILEDRAPQSAQKNINLQILRELELPVPPVNLQRNYSDLINRLRSYNSRNEQDAKELNTLFNSLLQRAFRGEL
jgi:type I restriction enzyme, S subunit